ncbi:MAG: c-type cytochrome, partial [Geminicoccaceae bacterium]|nr:c-type cytochrome [Geminicoccaceae bacterium]
MRRFLVRVAVLLASLGVCAFLVTRIGLVSIAASSGHWGITAWLLHSTMIHAVELQSAATEDPPDLDDPGLIQRGAGHFHTGCAPCHGAPGLPQSPIVLSMTPAPPSLVEKVPEWDPKELHWIVQHGVKFSGMPAWATQARPDEPWAVVAFLRKLPGMTPEAYRGLALGPAAGKGRGDPIDGCARCHGYDGLGRAPGAVPVLARLGEPYLYASLKAYASGERPSGVMQPQAKGLDDAAMRALASTYAGAKPAARPPTPAPHP